MCSNFSVLSTGNADILLEEKQLQKSKGFYHVLVWPSDCSEDGRYQTETSLGVGLV